MPHKEEISARTLDAIMGSVLDAVVAVDRVSVVFAWNDSAAQTFGWTREEALVPELVELIIPQRLRDGHRAGMERYHATGVASLVDRGIEISAIDRHGQEFPIELSIVAAPPGGFGYARLSAQEQRQLGNALCAPSRLDCGGFL